MSLLVNFSKKYLKIVWSGLVRSARILRKGRDFMAIRKNISEVKAQLSALVERVEQGEEVIIGRAGRPVAKIVRFSKEEKRRVPDQLKGQIRIEDDFDKLPEDLFNLFSGT